MKRKNLAIVQAEQKQDEDSPERFKRRTFHLKSGTGQPLESVLFKLIAEKDARA